MNSVNGGSLQVRWNSRIGKCLYEFITKLKGLSIILRISPGGNKLGASPQLEYWSDGMVE
jgi:hypothetical protein